LNGAVDGQEQLDENFILYHTKQSMDYPSSEMIKTDLEK